MIVKTYCQLWFTGSNEPVIVESLGYFRITNNLDLPLNPSLITCPIPRAVGDRVPIFVSLVENMCDIASNSLRVTYNKPADSQGKGGFVVCVKMLDYLHEDQSERLTEWIELTRLLGADKITFYTLFIHENMTKVLKYYERQGLVELSPTTLVGDEPNAPYFQHLYLRAISWEMRWMNEVVQVNDCFYKNMYMYHYVTPFDTDEVIMPNREYNWTGLMNTVSKETSSLGEVTSYQTRMVIFPDCRNVTKPFEDIPLYMYMLQHVSSDRNDNIQHTAKTFFHTEMMEALDNHWGVKCLAGECNAYWMNREDAETFHYRDRPYSETQWSCDTMRNDTLNTIIWRYKEPLINRTVATLYELGLV